MANSSPRGAALEAAIQLTRGGASGNRSAETAASPAAARSVQRKREHLPEPTAPAAGPSNATIQHAATEGTKTPSGALPFARQIQASFGRHSVAGIEAHLGNAAAESARVMQAKAYATGHHVVFGGSPDLTTAAHEAAHVVQQRAGAQPEGKVGREGDAFERHADAVAAKVARGESAEGLLDRIARPAGTARGTQRVSSVVQQVREAIAALTADAITVDALDALAASVEAQIAELDPLEKSYGFVVVSDLSTWQAAYPAQLATLRDALVATAGGVEAPETLVNITGKKNPRATLFEPALMTLSRMRKALNDSLNGFVAFTAKQASASSASSTATSFGAGAGASSSASGSTGKGAKSSSAASSTAAPTEGKEEKKVASGKTAKASGASSKSASSPASSSSAKKEAVAFPHKGKHCPPKGLVGNLAGLAEETAGPGEVALYKTNDPTTVLAWESTARSDGYRLADNFTVIHRLGEVIGADQGETTEFIRIDGDHGHPIIESGSKTSFDDYVKREIANLRKAANSARLRELADYLAGIGQSPASYKLKPAEIDWTPPSASSSTGAGAASSSSASAPAPAAEDDDD